MAINLSKGVNLFTPNSANQVVGTSSPTDYNTQGFNRQGDESGFFIKTVADGDGQMDPNHTLIVWFYYPTNQKWKEHISISYDNPQMEAHPGLNGHAVAWVADPIEGQPTVAYIETAEAEVRIHKIKHALITDSDPDNNSQSNSFVGNLRPGGHAFQDDRYGSWPALTLSTAAPNDLIYLQNVDHANGNNSQYNYIGENGEQFMFVPVYSIAQNNYEVDENTPLIKATMVSGISGTNTFRIDEVSNMNNTDGLISWTTNGMTLGDVRFWRVYELPGIDHNLTEDFISWYSNDVTQGVPGESNQQIINYDGYQRKYLDLSSYTIGDTYNCNVDGKVDVALLFTRMNEKQECTFVYDDKTKKSTISFEIPAGENGDYSTSLDRWHIWYSLEEVVQAPFKMTIETSNVSFQPGQYIPNTTMSNGPLDINMFQNVGGYTAKTVLSNAVVGTSWEIAHNGSAIPNVGTQIDLTPYLSISAADIIAAGGYFPDGTQPTLHCTITHNYAASFKVRCDAVSNINNHVNLPNNSNQSTGEVIRWKIWEAGTNAFDFPIIMKSGEDFSITVNWGDDTIQTLTQADFQTYANQSGFNSNNGSQFYEDAVGTKIGYFNNDVLYYMHSYSGIGNYQIEISGDHLPLAYGHVLETSIDNIGSITDWEELRDYQIETYDNYDYATASIMSSKYHIKSIDQWGEIEYTSLDRAFARCSNMDLLAEDAPMFGENASIRGLFEMCSNKFINSNYSIMNWNTTNVVDMSNLFCGTTTFNKPINTGSKQKVDGSHYLTWDVSNVKDFSQMFAGMDEIGQHNFQMEINNWNMMSAENMRAMFQYSRFNRNIPHKMVDADYYYPGSPAHPAWFFGTLTEGTTISLAYMFHKASWFNGNVDGWFLPRNAGQSVDLQGMFKNAISFNSPIDTALHSTGQFTDYSYSSSWRGDRVINSESMFEGCGLFNQNVGGLFSQPNTNVTISKMFKNCTVFDNGGSNDINNWNTSLVITMNSAFENCNFFNKSIASWDVSNVTKFQSMFEDAVLFNQDFGTTSSNSWNTSSGERFDSMFESAKRFNKNLYFDLSNAYSANSFLKNASSYSCQMYINFGDGSTSIGPQSGVTLDPTYSHYMKDFIAGTNYSTSLVNGLLIKWVAELRNLNIVTQIGHALYTASDGNTYEGLLEGLPAPHEANSQASTARFGLIQNGWWVEDNTVITPVSNNTSYDLMGWDDDATFSEAALIGDTLIGNPYFYADDADGNYSSSDFTVEWTSLTNSNGDPRSMDLFELVSHYGGSVFEIKLKEGFVYNYNSSWNDKFMFEFKLSTPNGSYRYVTRMLALTNEKPDGVEVKNMVDLGFPARNSNLLSSISTTTLTFTGSWSTTPYGILKGKYPGSGAVMSTGRDHPDSPNYTTWWNANTGTYGGQYLGSPSCGEPGPYEWMAAGGVFYPFRFDNLDTTDLPPSWPNVAAGPYIHISKSNFNSENDQEHFNNYKMEIADITDWINGAAANAGVNLKEGVFPEIVGVDADMGWWVIEGNKTQSHGTGSDTVNYFVEFRSSPLPTQAREIIEGKSTGLITPKLKNGWNSTSQNPLTSGFVNHLSFNWTPFAPTRSYLNGTWHNYNSNGWKDATNLFDIEKIAHTNPTTGENQDHFTINYLGEDLDAFPFVHDSFTQKDLETKSGGIWDNRTWNHYSWDAGNNEYIAKLNNNQTYTKWRKGLQFTIWYRFRDATQSSGPGVALGGGSKTDDNGIFSGTLKKICLVVRDNL